MRTSTRRCRRCRRCRSCSTPAGRRQAHRNGDAAAADERRRGDGLVSVRVMVAFTLGSTLVGAKLTVIDGVAAARPVPLRRNDGRAGRALN